MLSAAIRSVRNRACRGSPDADHPRPPGPAGFPAAGPGQKLLAPNDHVCGLSDVGRARDRNEDSFYVSQSGQLLLVADGMGGHQAGEVASTLAVETVAACLSTQPWQSGPPDSELVAQTMIQALMQAHASITEASTSREREGMGTTLIVACVIGDRLYTCHVGDVRCYVRTAQDFEQITSDHSIVGELVREGRLTPEQGRLHPNKNEILQALGMPHPVKPDVNSRLLTRGDRVLLCSDGLWEALPDAEIRAVLDWDGSMRQLATQLVDRANNAGGWDNITVVLYEHVPLESSDAACRL